MKYFIDFEFIEGFSSGLFQKRRHFIDLISIGVVREDGATYYAISNEFDYNDANKWVKENILDPLVREFVLQHHGDGRNWAMDRIENKGGAGSVRVVQKYRGKTNNQIRSELLTFFGCEYDDAFPGWFSKIDTEVYGYYADYDWVLLCSLFGRMIDLPKGFPMYCKDLKQTFDEKQLLAAKYQFDLSAQYSKPISMETAFDVTNLKRLNSFPKQANEHNALADAKWNLELYNFLQSI